MRFILMAAIALCCAFAAQAQTYFYVATNGNDISGTGSFNNPFATIGRAADAANAAVASNPTVPVFIQVRGGIYRNTGFTTTTPLTPASYAPETIGEAIWKTNAVTGTAVRLNNINGAATAWITIQPYAGEAAIIECDGDIAFSIRNCTYIKVTGLEIRGVLDMIPAYVAWQYWGTYRYLVSGNYVYGDRKQDICTVAGISPCTDIPPNLFPTGTTYTGLPNINNLNVERPNIFGGKGLLVQLSNHIQIEGNDIHNFPGGGLRVTQSDYVDLIGNYVHHNTSRSSVGTHGVVAEGLTADSGNNASIVKMVMGQNTVYSNYNELYSWVQSKTICTTAIDEGKGIALLRTSLVESNFNGIIRVENNIAYDNGKSGIHTNDVDLAEIVNNTVYLNGHTNIYNADISAGTNAGISIQASNSIKIINNIVLVSDGLSPALVALSEGQNCNGEVVSNNIIWGGGTSDFAGGYTVADPLFTDMPNNDVTLQSASPAINAGLYSVAPAVDFLNIMRGNPPESGAYEYIAPLPLGLLHFAVTNWNSAQINLEWAIESTHAYTIFEVEKSTNALDWKAIGALTRNQSAQATERYSFTDQEVSKGRNYYRLRMIDGEKGGNYSNIVSVEMPSGQMAAHPNPFTDYFVLTGINADDPVEVFDMTGRLMDSHQLDIQREANQVIVSIKQSGDHPLYIVRSGQCYAKLYKIK